MRQPERVPDLVRGHEADELAHHVLAKRGARAAGLTAAVWTKYQLRSRFITLWYQPMSDSRISPERGSETCGP